MDYIDHIENMGACTEAVEWLREKNYKSLATAWRYCKRGDWMLWLAAREGLTDERHKAMVLAACDCADLAAEYRRPKDRKVLKKAVKTTRLWVEGKATLDEVNDAARAAEAAARAAEAAWAAWAAGAAAEAAWAAAWAAARAAWAAGAAAEAACAAAWAAEADTLSQCADIVRKHLSCPVLEAQ